MLDRRRALVGSRLQLSSDSNASPLSFDSLHRSFVLLGGLVAEPNDGLVRRIAVKVVVHVLQRAVCGFWIEEVYHGEEDQVHGREYCYASVSCCDTQKSQPRLLM